MHYCLKVISICKLKIGEYATATTISHSDSCKTPTHKKEYDDVKWQGINLIDSSDDTQNFTGSLTSVCDLGGSVHSAKTAGTKWKPPSESNDTVKKVKERMNFKLLLMPKFLSLAIPIFLYTLGSSVVYGLLPALGKECGVGSVALENVIYE